MQEYGLLLLFVLALNWTFVGRKRPTDGVPEFDAAMSQIFNILGEVSKVFLQKARSGVTIDDSELEFAECICENMVSLGSSNWQSVSGDATIISFYLEQVTPISNFYMDGQIISFPSHFCSCPMENNVLMQVDLYMGFTVLLLTFLH